MNVSGYIYASSVFPTFWRQGDAFSNRASPERCRIHADFVFKALGADIAPKLIVQVLRSILSLDNIRRGPGQSGELQRFQDSSLKYLRYVYLDMHQFRSPWPTSLVVLYDPPSSGDWVVLAGPEA